MMLAVFAFGSFVAERFGKFVDENIHGYRELQEPDRRVYIAETEGKSTKVISEEVRSVLDSLSDYHDYEIIICRSDDPHIIEYLEESC